MPNRERWKSGIETLTFGRDDDDGAHDEGDDDYDDDDDDGDDGDDDIYIMMKCLFVCVSQKIITSSWEFPVTTWTTHNHPVQLRVSFDGSRLIFMVPFRFL